MNGNSASHKGFGYAEQDRLRREREKKRRQEQRKQREEEIKRQEEERKHRELELYYNSNERSPKRAKTERGSTSQSLITTNGEGGGGGSSTDQSRTYSRLQHLKEDSSLSVIRNLTNELEGERHPKSKMDLNMKEGIGMAIKVLDNSLKCCCDIEDLGEMVIDAVSQAQRALRAMKTAKEEQNKLRSALYALLSSGLE